MSNCDVGKPFAFRNQIMSTNISSGVYFEPNRGYCAFFSLFYPRIFEHRNILATNRASAKLIDDDFKHSPEKKYIA